MFRYPPSKWARIALSRKELRIASVLVGLFLVPAVFGPITGLGGSNTSQEMSISGIYSNRAATTLESIQLSELRTGTAASRDFELTAEVTTSPPFVWPAHGPLTSFMDPSHPMGIDIGLNHEVDSPIVAVARGKVSNSGYNGSYGYFVQVDHGQGLVTLYAHLSEIFVSNGQSVGQGELLGYGGSTGKSSGKHLHFEVRQGGFLANPLELLPAQESESSAIVSCDTGALVLDRGGVANLDFTNGMPGTARITGVSLRAQGETNAPLPVVTLVSDKSVRVETSAHIESIGVMPDAWYGVDLVIEDLQTFHKTCNVQVRTVMSYLTAYGDASVVAAEAGSPYDEDWTEPEYDDYHEHEEPDGEIDEGEDVPGEVPLEEETPEPVETPLAIPTNIPLLGEVASPTPSPTATPPSTATPTATETVSPTPTATETASPTPTATSTPAATSTTMPTASSTTTAN